LACRVLKYAVYFPEEIFFNSEVGKYDLSWLFKGEGVNLGNETG
jgi:hypothetical protein